MIGKTNTSGAGKDPFKDFTIDTFYATGDEISIGKPVALNPILNYRYINETSDPIEGHSLNNNRVLLGSKSYGSFLLKIIYEDESQTPPYKAGTALGFYGTISATILYQQNNCAIFNDNKIAVFSAYKDILNCYIFIINDDNTITYFNTISTAISNISATYCYSTNQYEHRSLNTCTNDTTSSTVFINLPLTRYSTSTTADIYMVVGININADYTQLSIVSSASFSEAGRLDFLKNNSFLYGQDSYFYLLNVNSNYTITKGSKISFAWASYYSYPVLINNKLIIPTYGQDFKYVIWSVNGVQVSNQLTTQISTESTVKSHGICAFYGASNLFSDAVSSYTGDSQAIYLWAFLVSKDNLAIKLYGSFNTSHYIGSIINMGHSLVPINKFDALCVENNIGSYHLNELYIVNYTAPIISSSSANGVTIEKCTHEIPGKCALFV